MSLGISIESQNDSRAQAVRTRAGILAHAHHIVGLPESRSKSRQAEHLYVYTSRTALLWFLSCWFEYVVVFGLGKHVFIPSVPRHDILACLFRRTLRHSLRCVCGTWRLAAVRYSSHRPPFSHSQQVYYNSVQLKRRLFLVVMISYICLSTEG